AALTGDDARNQALYKGDQLLLRKGDAVDGMVITTIGGTTATGGIGEGFSVSEDGRYVIVRVRFDDSPRGVVLLDLGGGCAGPSDMNCDGSVDVQDLIILLGNFGPCPDPCTPDCAGDLNDDCSVDVQDILTLLSNFG